MDSEEDLQLAKHEELLKIRMKGPAQVRDRRCLRSMCPEWQFQCSKRLKMFPRSLSLWF